MSLQKTAESVLNLVKDAGAEGDLITQESQSLSLKAQAGALEEHSVNSGMTLGVRVVKDGQVGSAFSEATDEESLRFMVDQALTNAHFSKEKPDETIIPLTSQTDYTEPYLMPEDDSTIEEKIDFVIELESALSAFDDIRNVPYNGLGETVRTLSLFNSNGGLAMQSSRQVYAYGYPLAAEGDVTAMAGAMETGRLFSELNLQALIQRCHEDSTALLSGKPISTGRYDVIFHRNVLPQLFGAFSAMWSGKWAQDEINPIRNNIGETIFDKRLTIYDNPLNAEGLDFTAFDDEGLPTAETTLVDNGKLVTLAHNSATAKHFNVANTHHAARSPKSGLNVSVKQLHVASGPDSRTDVFAGDVFEITSLDGLHSGVNHVSGDFSCGASGFLLKDGERTKVVRGVTVAGNFYSMLNNIARVGDSVQWDEQKSTLLPTIRFADLAISGQ